MFIGPHEIWPLDWVGFGCLVLGIALFVLAKRLNSPSVGSKS